MSPGRFDPHLVANLRQELQALGVWEALEDPDTTDVLFNESGAIFVASLTGLQRLPGSFEPALLESAIGTLASLYGREAHRRSPLLEALLPFGGIRAQATLPPVSTSPCLTLRKPPSRRWTLDDLVERGMLPAALARELAEALLQRENLVLAGGVGSGKTTLARALLGELLAKSPDERLLTLEEGARELSLPGDNVVSLLTDEEAGIDARRLLRHALRSNPDRILLGEARGAEAYDFLKAAHTGHPGAVLTLHAGGLEDALLRLDALAQEAGVPSQREVILRTVDWVVILERRGVTRQVREVGRLEDGALLRVWERAEGA